MSYSIGTDSEVGWLRTVLVHRPGPELRRITPRTKSRLGFDGQPWVARAQQEHDALTDLLRDRGAEVLYVTELLQDVLEFQSARDDSIASVLADAELGDVLGASVRQHLESLAPLDLAAVLVAGLTVAELRTGSGLVYDLLDPHDFVVSPLPNLVFTRESSVWIGDQAVIACLPGPRRRETELMAVIYGHHPRFGGLRSRYDAGAMQLDGGDVLLLAPGVVAVGVGVRTSPASAERLAKHLLEAGVAHTVLAVPMNQRGEGGHLDRVCTVVDSGVVIMEAAARALDIDRLTVIDTGLDSPSGQAGQWDDGGNALAVGPRVAVCNERNVETNARLAGAGFDVITVPGSELGAFRGGPRCLCAPIRRDPVPMRELARPSDESVQPAGAPQVDPAVVSGTRVPGPAGPAKGPRARSRSRPPAGASGSRTASRARRESRLPRR